MQVPGLHYLYFQGVHALVSKHQHKDIACVEESYDWCMSLHK